MKKIFWAAAAMFAIAAAGTVFAGGTATVSVTATVVPTCSFNSGGSIAFGSLDPAVGTDVNGTVTQPVFWCTNGTGYTITDDDGLHKSGTTHRLIGPAASDLIPYTFTYTATGTGSGRTSPITMAISSTILGTDYRFANPGAYSDTVTLTITP